MSPTHSRPVPTGRANDLHLATSNAAALWVALAKARGHDLVRRRDYLAVRMGHRGLRVLLLGPDPNPVELAEAKATVREHRGGSVVVEDPFGSVDVRDLGLTPRQLPVMIRRPAPIPAPSRPVPPATRVVTPEQLLTCERVVVDGFPLGAFQPYRAGEAFPARLLDDPAVGAFLVVSEGKAVGACLTIFQEGVGGLYWVTTLPDHRSSGVGRALARASLAYFDRSVVTLTSSKSGKPLYDSLGFTTIAHATWWVGETDGSARVTSS